MNQAILIAMAFPLGLLAICALLALTHAVEAGLRWLAAGGRARR
mgnify:CR=1 FL=1